MFHRYWICSLKRLVEIFGNRYISVRLIMLSNSDQSTMNPDPPATLAWGGAAMTSPHSDNPWNKNNPIFLEDKDNESCGEISFHELMSEDLARELQQRDDQHLFDEASDFNSPMDIGTTNDTSNDLLLALILQHDFNKEHDSQIQREEKHFNKNSKLSVSFSNYKVYPECYDSESDEEYNNINDEHRALDRFEESRKSDPVIPACGYTRHNNKMVTKHDKIISGRRNAERVMNFPPGINTGDAGCFDMQISNQVYNKLARSAMTESKRKQRVHDKMEKATTEQALDPKTRLIVYKMVNNSILDAVNGIISTGKESVVFHALGGTYEEEKLPSECAIKVFKTTLADFKTRERYIRHDYRFKDRMSKNNNKMTIQLWAEKEFHNLRRLQKAKIPSPKPLIIKKHVLVMSFIGSDQVAAPKLKHIRLSHDEWASAYGQVVDMMKTMFRDCKLVHGDMNEYNVLWFEDKCWVIDLGQAVEPVHPNALKFLHRDCSNIVGFFKSKGLMNMPSPLQLFEKITGINLPEQEEEAHRLIETYEVGPALWRDGCHADDQFESLWKDTHREDKKEALKETEDIKDAETEINDLKDNVECLCIIQDELSEEKGDYSKGKMKKKRKKKIKTAVVTNDGIKNKIAADQDFVYVEKDAEAAPSFKANQKHSQESNSNRVEMISKETVGEIE